MTVLKPFLMVASVAFVAGFAGYLAVAELAVTQTTPSAPVYQAPISAPAPAGWDAGKPV